ncbi:hypothetical protein QJS04_geneDACA014943 [Acorus gramineus]|uniref:Methyltransferase domain-containing protein n=1 Tax=Acorus gramineus TaxID=55184 RepID=A0AAV9BUD1_ACOGR|nr:hypothetical protein QJS04_geneDACA014943 [Acorus gramineus]
MMPDLCVMSLGSVLSQGMNPKKKHEVEILSAVISKIADNVGAQTIIDVGSGQGYLAQVLSFLYQLAVVAIDASSHHGSVTSARAVRIKKHYSSKLAENKHLNGPEAVTCHVLSSNMLTSLATTLFETDSAEESREIGQASEDQNFPCSKENAAPPLILAGLHACGDLSVNMLRTFVDCQEVKALVGIGCCYNLLSEEYLEGTSSQSGFPVSKGAKLTGINFGRNARDLACQSAERWRSLSNNTALQNFGIHAFRAAFQIVIDKHYPDMMASSPSIGRQGKALRRKQSQRVTENKAIDCKKEALELTEIGKVYGKCNEKDLEGYQGTCAFGLSDEYAKFEKFCYSGITRLGLPPVKDINFQGLWKQVKPFSVLVGPYWTLRAALGPLIETFILLDKLLFLQEQGIKAAILPLFDPVISPRNVAVIARKI